MAQADYEQTYAACRAYFGSVPTRWLDEFLGCRGDGKTVLDLGSGQGRNALHLARQGYDVTAVDSSCAAIDELRRQARRERLPVNAFCQDICEFPVEKKSYDAIVAVTVLCHLDPERIPETARRITGGLRPGGLLLAEEFTPEDPGARGDAPSSEFAPLVENYFSVSALERLFPSLERMACRVLTVTDDTHGQRHRHSLVRYVAKRSNEQ